MVPAARCACHTLARTHTEEPLPTPARPPPPTSNSNSIVILSGWPTSQPDWFRKLNPKGEVPVLVLEDSIVVVDSESTLDVLFPDDQGQANVKAWRRRISKELAPVGKKAVQSGDRARLMKLLQDMEQDIVGPFLCGSSFTAADAACCPFIQRIESEFGLDGCPAWASWWDECKDRGSVKSTIRTSWWWWW